MNWTLEYLPEAEDDLKNLDGSVKAQVVKGIRKVLKNPLSKKEGGYGDPLGNRSNSALPFLIRFVTDIILPACVQLYFLPAALEDKVSFLQIMECVPVKILAGNSVYRNQLITWFYSGKDRFTVYVVDIRYKFLATT